MRFYSYAQDSEDIVLFAVLQDVSNIFYIDVGANDPTYISVTKAFYERGGCGINIEPLRNMCQLLSEERPRDINLCIGIGAKEGEMELYCAGTASSFNADVIKNANLDCANRHRKKILTLTQVYEFYCKEKQPIHFCKIDVEGYEREVLKGCSFDIFRPWIFVIESAEPGTTIPSQSKWEDILIRNGYKLGYETQINRYYFDERLDYLADRFTKVNDFLENNQIFKMEMKKVECIN